MVPTSHALTQVEELDDKDCDAVASEKAAADGHLLEAPRSQLLLLVRLRIICIALLIQEPLFVFSRKFKLFESQLLLFELNSLEVRIGLLFQIDDF